MDENKPQARGRGRGRSSQQPTAQSSGVTAPPTAAPGQSAVRPQMPASSNGRGRVRPDAAPSGGVAGVTQGMAQMSVASSGGTGAGEQQASGAFRARGGITRRLRNAVIEPANLAPLNKPRIGTGGQPVQLSTNFVALSELPTASFYIFDLNLMAFGKIFEKRLEAVEKLIAIISRDKPIPPYAFDGRRLYSTVEFVGADQTEEREVDGKLVKIRRVGEGFPHTEEYYQLMNIIFNNVQVYMGQERIGRGYYVSTKMIRSAQRTETFAPGIHKVDQFNILSGYATTLQRGADESNQPRPLMYIERSHRITNEQTVHDSLRNQKYRTMELVGRDVITFHNNKTYKINDLREGSIDDTFECGEQTTTYREYFQSRYHITLRAQKQFFVISNPKRRDTQRNRGPAGQKSGGDQISPPITLILPGEVCFLTGFSESERINAQRNQEFIKHTKRGPEERIHDVPNYVRWIQSQPKAQTFLKRWGINVNTTPLNVNGRELPQPTINCWNKNQNAFSAQLSKKGPDHRSRSEWETKFIQLKPVGKQWNVGLLVSDRIQRLDQFLQNFQRAAASISFPMKPVDQNQDVVPYDSRQLGKIGEYLQEFFEMHYDIVLVLGVDNRSYQQVKLATLGLGLPTQCMTKRNAEAPPNKIMSIATKVALQMACKLGSDAWVVKELVCGAPTMFVGLDTYHSKGSKKSVQAAVFSINSTFTQYLSLANEPEGRTEMQTNLAGHFMTALTHFEKLHRRLPSNIVIYRDGVGDSQLEFCKESEVQNVLDTVKTMYQEKEALKSLHVMFIVVKKRITCRFVKGNKNPLPGTVVDRDIVKPNFYEFFLVSQSTRQGTVGPANFNVLEDWVDPSAAGESKLKWDPFKVQNHTFQLSHLYYNWSGTIKVPAPVHYAHRLAEFMGKVGFVNNKIHDALRDKLFYL